MTNPTPTAALKLLPCPFCGGEALIDHHEPHSHSEALQRLIPGIPDHPGSYTIECCGKGCNTGQIADTEAEIVAMWNTRATEPALDTERGLPELPEGRMYDTPAGLETRYSKKDMREYAQAISRAALDKAGDGVALAKAKRALIRAGFVDHGGEEWKPPLGPAPRFIKMLASDPAETDDPLDWPIPCDLVDGAVTFRKGVPLRTVWLRCQMLSDAYMRLANTLPSQPLIITHPAPQASADDARDAALREAMTAISGRTRIVPLDNPHMSVHQAAHDWNKAVKECRDAIAALQRKEG